MKSIKFEKNTHQNKKNYVIQKFHLNYLLLFYSFISILNNFMRTLDKRYFWCSNLVRFLKLVYDKYEIFLKCTQSIYIII